MTKTTDKTTEVLEPQEMHLDDYLNHMESFGKREALAAFGKTAKASGIVKKQLEEWEKDFETFLKSEPK